MFVFRFSILFSCYQANYEPVSGGGVGAGVKGGHAAMGAVRLGLRGDVDGGSRGRTDRGGEETDRTETD